MSRAHTAFDDPLLGAYNNYYKLLTSRAIAKFEKMASLLCNPPSSPVSVSLLVCGEPASVRLSHVPELEVAATRLAAVYTNGFTKKTNAPAPKLKRLYSPFHPSSVSTPGMTIQARESRLSNLLARALDSNTIKLAHYVSASSLLFSLVSGFYGVPCLRAGGRLSTTARSPFPASTRPLSLSAGPGTSPRPLSLTSTNIGIFAALAAGLAPSPEQRIVLAAVAAWTSTLAPSLTRSLRTLTCKPARVGEQLCDELAAATTSQAECDLTLPTFDRLSFVRQALLVGQPSNSESALFTVLCSPASEHVANSLACFSRALSTHPRYLTHSSDDWSKSSRSSPVNRAARVSPPRERTPAIASHRG